MFPKYMPACPPSCLKLFALHNPLGINNFHLCVALIRRYRELLWLLSGSQFSTRMILEQQLLGSCKIQASFLRILRCSKSLTFRQTHGQTFIKIIQTYRYLIRYSGGMPGKWKWSESSTSLSSEITGE